MNTRSAPPARPYSPARLRPDLSSLRLLVVKVGSRILADGTPLQCRRRIGRLVDDITTLMRGRVRVVLVTSGAIAHGMHALGLPRRPATIPGKQACASIGQSRLMHLYETHFAPHGIVVGQVLLSWDDLRDKQRYLNLRNTLFELMHRGVLPIVNENDSVGIEEIRFGDNDTLGAQIALLVGADAYVMLTDVNGLYDRDPRAHAGARHLPAVERLTDEIRSLGGGALNGVSVGGMATKLKAARIVTSGGVPALIGNGFTGRLRDVLADPAAATLFAARPEKMAARDRWIAFAGKPRGRITIDDGAAAAVTRKGKSLLPAGIRDCTGVFAGGDPVEIANTKGDVLARGLANYSSDDLSRIKGLRTTEISRVLGEKPFDEAVHRDNLVVLGEGS